jgi:hypothetical protein
MKKLQLLVMLMVVSCAPAAVLTGCSSFDPQDPTITPSTIESPTNSTTTTTSTSTSST